MKKLVPLFPLLVVALIARADFVSINFVKNATWDLQNISDGETFGLADYDGSGTSTVTATWNALEYDTADHLDLTGEAGPTEVDVAIQNNVSQGASPGANNTANKAGLTLYGDSAQLAAATVSSVNTFSTAYDLVLYFSFGANATSATITVNGSDTVLTGPGSGGEVNQSIVLTGLTADTLTFDWTNTTPAGSGTAAVFGGMQIVDTSSGSGPTWAGYDILQDGWVDTTPWMGYINVSAGDWVWSASLNKYLYLPEVFVSESGSWAYAPGF
jgi:hypothetical protein